MSAKEEKARHQAVRPQAVRLERLPAHESVANALRQQILEGQLPPNSALREGDLCKAFDVSRHTVRSALHSLSFEGLVRQESHRAAYIPTLTPENIYEIFEMRAILERAAIQHAAGNPDALVGIEAALDRLRDLGPDASWGEIRDADLEFHQRLVETIGNDHVSRSFHALRLELRLGFLQIRDELRNQPEILKQHEAMLKALKADETERCLELLQQHLDDSVSSIAEGARQLLEDQGPAAEQS